MTHSIKRYYATFESVNSHERNKVNGKATLLSGFCCICGYGSLLTNTYRYGKSTVRSTALSLTLFPREQTDRSAIIAAGDALQSSFFVVKIAQLLPLTFFSSMGRWCRKYSAIIATGDGLYLRYCPILHPFCCQKCVVTTLGAIGGDGLY